MVPPGAETQVANTAATLVERAMANVIERL